jgi:aspartyl aminopeptidase
MPAKKQLTFEPQSAWDGTAQAERQKWYRFAQEYAWFLDAARTERLATAELKALVGKAGFVPLEKLKKWKPGARIYADNRGKSLYLAVLGNESLEKGFNLIASHLDAPRLDLKQRPLFQDPADGLNLALLRTHYYGGIKKYQWVNLPLGLFGRVVRRDGTMLDLAIGLEKDDPCFAITDLLPHLAKKEQGERKEAEVIRGEELLIICGGIPVADPEAKHRVKLAVLEHLHREYGLEEEDLVSAELEAVPLTPVRFVGFDRSFLGGYGQDDKICSYTSTQAILGLGVQKRTALVACVDKEEIGSEGNTGIQSACLVNFIGDLMELSKPGCRERDLRRCLASAQAISADVNAAVEPNFKQVHELSNAAKAGFGLVLTKFTGHGGKREANDASAEFMGTVREILNRAGVPWQAAELGRVDEGGGGTVAKFLARYGMDIVDCGPGLLSMHSPFELVSVADLHATYRGYAAFLAHGSK